LIGVGVGFVVPGEAVLGYWRREAALAAERAGFDAVAPIFCYNYRLSVSECYGVE
jgi:hypothetical protein